MNVSQPVAIAGEPTCAVIAEVVAEFYGVSVLDLRSHRKAALLTRPRSVVYFLCKELTKHSLAAIGRHLGGRDHTTVYHGIQRLSDELEADDVLVAELAAIRSILQQLLARVGVLIGDQYPDQHAPDIARRVLGRHRGEYTVSMEELRVLLNFAVSSGTDAAPVKPEPAPEIGETASAITAVLTAFREFERARFSRDEGRASDTLTQKLKSLRDAWHSNEGASR